MGRKDVCHIFVEYIVANIMKNLTLDDIANAVCFSKSYMQYMFKQEMGVSMMKFIHSNKMTIAKTMLEEGKAPSLVAKQLGYVNYQSFRMKFKYYYGVSPLNI